MDSAILNTTANPETAQKLKEIVVAYDASPSAERALYDAMALARRFGSEILLVQAKPLIEEPMSSCSARRDEAIDELNDLEAVRRRLAIAGLSSRGIVRGGIVGDTLFNICCDESADLLLLGAYGFGLQDRLTLGSTAEYLLRAVPCPTLTYGPEVCFAFDPDSHKGPVLVPVSLPCDPGHLERAMEIARLFNVGLEIMHASEVTHFVAMRDLEFQCEILADRLRSAGIPAQWSVYSGTPACIIQARSAEIDSPFILMPLKWRDRLSSITSDNVAAHVIRSSKVPVMTYRVD
jgi:nucleotide-binding universal stress UspA family protein